MTNFAEILNTKVESIERPPLPPVGAYVFAVASAPEFGEMSSDKGEWDTITFQMQAVAPGDTVDADEVAKFGLQNIRLRNQFMFDRGDAVKQDQTKFRLKIFLEEHLGLDSKGKSLSQLLSDAQGAQCIGVVRYRADKSNPEIQYAEISKTAPLN